MASADMKAVITLTADASGVQSGVQQAMKSLNGMADQLGAFRNGIAGQAINQLFSMSQSAFEQVSQRITDAAHAYSPEAMSGANNLAITQQQQDQKLGQAYGDVVAFIDNFKAQGIIDVTNYLIENKDAIGKAMENMAILGVAVADVASKLAVDFANSINFVADLLDKPTSTIADTTVGITQSVFGTDAAIWLQGIYQKMGGD